MQILIQGGHVIDPGHINGIRDILIDDGFITEIAESGELTFPPGSADDRNTRII